MVYPSLACDLLRKSHSLVRLQKIQLPELLNDGCHIGYCRRGLDLKAFR